MSSEYQNLLQLMRCLIAELRRHNTNLSKLDIVAIERQIDTELSICQNLSRWLCVLEKGMSINDEELCRTRLDLLSTIHTHALLIGKSGQLIQLLTNLRQTVAQCLPCENAAMRQAL